MLAAEILDTFKKLGITARVSGDKLIVEPGSKLLPDLKPEIRQRKAEIMALLFQPNAESDKLLSRLRAGTEWLTAQHKSWLDGNPYAESDERFSAAVEGWDLLERKLRQEFGYEGCIFGPDQRCPEDAPVRCDACVDDQD